ncbi:MAG: methionyl aminopeptidase [Lachnospiraceae bacterium]|nr:methionyl aminopeptidase [Lachnospiraceae bacterium]
MFRRIRANDACWCGSGKPYHTCHMEFDKKVNKARWQGHEIPSHRIIKNEKQIEGIRESGKLNIAVLDHVAERIKAGVTTEEINRWVHDFTVKHGGIPAPLGFEGFPKSVCTSIDSQVCHGIPSEDVVLKDGDIINVDVSTILNGYYSDSSRMFLIGNVDPEKEKLVRVTKEAVEKGLEEVKPWGFLGDMGQAVHDHVRANGYTVVYEVGGHGVGLRFHEEPFVSYTTKRGEEMLMTPGMIFTIEPMVNMGGYDIYVDEKNGWTIYTEDGKPSAQWEIMVLVTENGHEVLAY